MQSIQRLIVAAMNGNLKAKRRSLQQTAFFKDAHTFAEHSHGRTRIRSKNGRRM